MFPFFLVNMLMGLTPMPVLPFALVSQVGMLPGTIVYVNAGTQLAALTSLRGHPLAAGAGLIGPAGGCPLDRAAAPGPLEDSGSCIGPGSRPPVFDRNLIVIGAGAAGLVTSYIAATVKARVTLVEADQMGGDCLNTGCVPSKALIRTARLAARLRHGDRYGLAPQDPQLDLRRGAGTGAAKVAAVAPHDSVERYTALGVDVRLGHARLVNPWTVAITASDGSEPAHRPVHRAGHRRQSGGSATSPASKPCGRSPAKPSGTPCGTAPTPPLDAGAGRWTDRLRTLPGPGPTGAAGHPDAAQAACCSAARIRRWGSGAAGPGSRRGEGDHRQPGCERRRAPGSPGRERAGVVAEVERPRPHRDDRR